MKIILLQFTVWLLLYKGQSAEQNQTGTTGHKKRSECRGICPYGCQGDSLVEDVSVVIDTVLDVRKYPEIETPDHKDSSASVCCDAPYAHFRSNEDGRPTVGSSGSCYMALSSALQWGKAQKECDMGGGYLVAIETKEELEHIKEHIGKSKVSPIISFWIGGMLTEKKKWVWVSSKEKFQFKNWAAGQPEISMMTSSNRVLMDRREYYWIPAFETLIFTGICEKEVQCQ